MSWSQNIQKVIIGCSMVTSISCISYNQYDADISSSDLNNRNIVKINTTVFTKDTLNFAIISDTHNNYDDLEDAIKAINQQTDLSFVICTGDITLLGAADEFKWYWNLAKKSKFPIITMIGNHDHLGSGRLVFKRMFGSTNFSFHIGEYRFVAFDNTVWENNNQSPDFDWLDEQLSAGKYNILFAHIPIWSDQMEGKYEQKFDSVLINNNLLVALYGHEHTNKDVMRNNITHYVVADIADRQFAIVRLIGSTVLLKRISF